MELNMNRIAPILFTFLLTEGCKAPFVGPYEGTFSLAFAADTDRPLPTRRLSGSSSLYGTSGAEGVVRGSGSDSLRQLSADLQGEDRYDNPVSGACLFSIDGDGAFASDIPPTCDLDLQLGDWVVESFTFTDGIAGNATESDEGNIHIDLTALFSYSVQDTDGDHCCLTGTAEGTFDAKASQQ